MAIKIQIKTKEIKTKVTLQMAIFKKQKATHIIIKEHWGFCFIILLFISCLDSCI